MTAFDIETEGAEIALDPTPTLWNGQYLKIFYNVHLPSGEIVKCWPNAGYMVAGDGSGRMWRPEDKVMVTVADNDEFKSEVMWQRKQAAIAALANGFDVDEAVELFRDKVWPKAPISSAFERLYAPIGAVADGMMLRAPSRWEQNKRAKHQRYLAKKKR